MSLCWGGRANHASTRAAALLPSAAQKPKSLQRVGTQAPGTILSAGKQGIEVACGDGMSLFVTELQAQGGKRMSAAAYLLGHPISL